MLHEIRAAGKKRSAADGKAALMDISVKTVSEDDEKGIPWPVMPLFGLVNRASLGILPFMPRQKATCLRVELQPESQPSTRMSVASSVEKEPRASRSAKSSVAPAQTPIVKPMPARPVAPPSPSTLEDLLKQGVVTQEEFDRLAK